MRIAVVTPMMRSGEKGGAEELYDGLLRHLALAVGDAGQVDRVEVSIDESNFDAVMESYDRCAALDLDGYDLVVSTKAPTYMVRHRNHVSYLLHTLRVFYDMFGREYGAGTPEQHRQRAIVHARDKEGLHPDRVRKHLANGSQTFKRLYEIDPFWRQVPFRAVHHPPALEGFREPGPGRWVFLPGRLHRWKRADLVIEAFKRVRRDIGLKISGTGEDERALRALAGGDPRIEFLGRATAEQLVDSYAGALVVPFVPVLEDYGLVTIEAFRAAKPVITCTDSGEPTVFVKDDVTGFVVEPDPEQIARKIEYLADHSEAAEEMGRRGRAAAASITWESVVGQILPPPRPTAVRSNGKVITHAPVRGTADVGAAGAADPAAAPRRIASPQVTVLDMQPIEPPTGGGRIRLLGLYHGLGRDMPTTYVGTYDWPGPAFRRHRHSETLEEVTVPLGPEHFAAADALKQKAGGRNVIDVAFDLLADRSPEYLAAAREAAAAADVVVFSHPWVYPLVKDHLRPGSQVLVYDSHNVEGLLRYTLLDDGGGAGTELTRHVAAVEAELCHAADLVLACSHEDRTLFRDIYGVPFAKMTVVPNGSFASKLRPASPEERGRAKHSLGLGQGPLAVFLGSAYQPNVEAATFLRDVLAPSLPDVTFGICGGVGGALGDVPVPPNVRVTGFLQEEEKLAWLAAADLALNPMSSGSGTNIKMLDYMAVGLPTVSTPVGARGIFPGSAPGFETRDLADFAEAVARIVSDADHAAALAAAGRRVLEEHYTWERISARLGSLLRRHLDAIGRPHASRPFFSVIVPAYERPDLLTELARRLRSQTSQDFEVIIVDQSRSPWPGRGDFADLDLLYLHSDLKGAVGARNLGAMHARGEVLAFIDDDCQPFPDWLQRARPYFDAPATVGVEGLIESDKLDDPGYRPVTNRGFEGIGFMTANLFVRRETFNAVDGFDPVFDHPHFREDTDFGWRAAERGHFPFARDARVFHPPHRRTDARESQAERNRFFEKDVLLMRKHPERYRDLFLREGHYLRDQGFKENFLRGSEKYGIPIDDFYLALLAGAGGADVPGRISPINGPDGFGSFTMTDVADSGPVPVGPGDEQEQDEQHLALLADLRQLLGDYRPPAPGEPLHPLDAFFAYRLLLRRNPDPRKELPALLQAPQTFRQFLSSLLASPEYYHSSGVFPANRMLMGEVEGLRFWFNTSDREMGVLMALGMYEPKSVSLFKKLLRPGMKCLDLGAQTGFYTCLMASLVGPKGRVYSFEPLPSSYQILDRNVRENGFEGRVQTFPKAASSDSSVIEGSLTSNMFIAGEVAGAERVRMETCRVDDVVQGPIDFIKIDIEGHEPSAIEGMRKLIAKSKPVIVSEANEYWLRNCSQSSGPEYVRLLQSLGYEVYRVENPSKPIDPDELELDILDSIDVIAIPADQGNARGRAALAAAGAAT